MSILDGTVVAGATAASGRVAVIAGGLGVGLSAVGSAATFGLWNGGAARSDPSFSTSVVLANVGLTAASFALPVGGLCAGSRTVLYSGEGALNAANAGKGVGMILADTPIGGWPNAIDKARGGLPKWIWQFVSGIFVLNAKGEVLIFLRNPVPNSVFMTVERTLLLLFNKTLVFR